MTLSPSQKTRQKRRSRTGPVWRASGPFVKEALRLVTSIDATLRKLVSRGYPLGTEARTAHEALERLQTMLDRELDEAEALQAAGGRSFVTDEPPPAESAKRELAAAARDEAERAMPEIPLEDVAPALELESEAAHDD